MNRGFMFPQIGGIYSISITSYSGLVRDMVRFPNPTVIF